MSIGTVQTESGDPCNDPLSRILMLVPHEPREDPRIKWVTDLCRQVAFTEILSTVYARKGPARELDDNVYLERAVIAEHRSFGARLAARCGASFLERGSTRRYIRRRLVAMEAKASPELTWTGEAALTPVKRGLLRRAACSVDSLIGSALRFSGYYLSLRPLVSAMKRRARAISIVPRVIVCHDLFALSAAVLLKRMFGCPIIYDSHEYWPEADLLSEAWEVNAWAAIERRLIRQADVVVTVTPQLARHLQDLYGLREVLSVPNAEPLAPIESPSCNRAPTHPVKFLLQGQVAPARGIEALLSAWGRLNDRRAILYVRCPENPFQLLLKDRFAELCNRGHLVFLPAVAPEELVPAAAFADVGVIPYALTTLNHVYCCPNKLSQYMQAGLAILSTNSTFVSDVLLESGAGLTYALTTPESFVTAARSILDEPERLQMMKRNALAFSRSTFNWEKQSAPYLEAISRYFQTARAAA